VELPLAEQEVEIVLTVAERASSRAGLGVGSGAAWARVSPAARRARNIKAVEPMRCLVRSLMRTSGSVLI